jgi:hypothetical protein
LRCEANQAFPQTLIVRRGRSEALFLYYTIVKFNQAQNDAGIDMARPSAQGRPRQAIR